MCDVAQNVPPQRCPIYKNEIDLAAAALIDLLSRCRPIEGVRHEACANIRDAGGASKPAERKSATSASKEESPGEYVDDTVITAKVKAAVLEEPALESAEISVETLKGTVQLTGFVRCGADIAKAVSVAKGVAGVKSVKNDMILKGAQ
jgi:osmotically-inducible protein OsmY